MPTRDTKLDSVKTVLIFGVVLEHMLQSRDPGVLNSINVAVKTALLPFLMPLFILISGYFCNTKCDKATLFKKVLELLATYIVFQLIRSVLMGKYGLDAVLSPRYTLWYLLCLIYWRIVVYFLSRWLSLNAILIVSVIISLCSGYIHSNALSLQRACSFFPFFVLGYYFHNYPHDILKKIDNSHIVYSITALIIGSILYIMMQWDMDINLKKVFAGRNPYIDDTDIFVRGVWLMTSTIISVAVYRLIPDRKILAKYGGCTLVVYLLHSFFTQGLGWLMNRHYIVWNDLIINIIFALIIFILCVLLGKLEIIRKLVKPISFK